MRTPHDIDAYQQVTADCLQQSIAVLESVRESCPLQERLVEAAREAMDRSKEAVRRADEALAQCAHDLGTGPLN